MSLLRIRCPLRSPSQQCQWALLDLDREPVMGEGGLADLSRGAGRVQLVIPAADVLITRARLPQAARRGAGSLLAYAVEENTLGEPEANQVSWLGMSGDQDALAVMDRAGLKHWFDVFDAAGIRAFEVHCEMLFLPWVQGEWSLAWDGREGYVRSAELEAGATDCGDRVSPPLSLRLMLEQARVGGGAPASIALYATAPDATPDAAAWQRELGVTVRLAGPWDWRTAPPASGVILSEQRQRWRLSPAALTRLRPAAWIVGVALAIHTLALVADWALLAAEQSALRRQMETRFRSAFPDAVAVVDPDLQMRRKLADARHAAGLPDSGDFLPVIEKVAAGLRGLPAGALRTVSYESGRMTLELVVGDEPAMRRIVARLQQTGLGVDTASAQKSPGSTAIFITVRAL